MILLTGAAGKTGRTILNHLLQYSVKVRSLVRSPKQADDLAVRSDVIIGDLHDTAVLARAVKGVDAIYFICPNMTPDEVEIGKSLLDLARGYRVKRFVYHSVLHPQVEDMPHHWQKMRMEELIFESGMDFTILQPCAYMQNILQYWKSITEQGIYAVPYATSARISIADLEDIAEVARLVLTQDTHQNATYELAGPQALSQEEVAEVLSKELGKKVVAQAVDRSSWSDTAKHTGMDDYQRITLLRMFEYYDHYGLVGNPNTMNYLLQRPAHTFTDFVRRQLATMNHAQ